MHRLFLESFRQENKVFYQGFTLLEFLVILVIVGVLAAISVPGWFRFFASHQATVARGHLRQDIQQAQLKSQQNNVLWQFSVRENSGVVETAIHPVSISPTLAVWEPLDKSIGLDAETSLLASGGVHYVRFDSKGNVRRSSLGRVTVSSKRFPDVKRCVIVSTLIGATRISKEQPTPDPGYRTRDRFCY